MDKSNLAREDQVNALDTILEQSLAVRNEDDVLLIYDESFLPYLDAFIECVNNRDLLATFMHIPKSYQLRLTETHRRGETGARKLPHKG